MSDKLNLIDTIANQDKFSTFTRLMASSGANGVFDDGGDFTVFVPTNDAFAKVPEHKINELLNEVNQTKLKALLSYHILSGKVMSGSLGGTPSRRAFSGDYLAFTDSNGLKVNGASIQARNIEATNGVVHAVDTVLAPEVAATGPSTPLSAAPPKQAILAAVPNRESVPASATTTNGLASAARPSSAIEPDADPKPIV